MDYARWPRGFAAAVTVSDTHASGRIALFRGDADSSCFPNLARGMIVLLYRSGQQIGHFGDLSTQ
jgi:hypothetical protein